MYSRIAGTGEFSAPSGSQSRAASLTPSDIGMKMFSTVRTEWGYWLEDIIRSSFRLQIVGDQLSVFQRGNPGLKSSNAPVEPLHKFVMVTGSQVYFAQGKAVAVLIRHVTQTGAGLHIQPGLHERKL